MSVHPELVALLRDVGAIGSYFAVHTDDAPTDARPLVDLYDAGPDAPMAHGIRRVRLRLDVNEPRVAASTLHLGIAARLWSITLGCATLGGVVPDLDPERTHWRLPHTGPLELWSPSPRPADAGDGPSGDLPRLAAILYVCTVERHLEPLSDAVRAATAIAPRLLWGNAASALVGVARVLEARLSSSRPDAARTAYLLAGRLLSIGRLRATGTLTAHPPSFRRTSCCLYYRTPHGGLCGDCVLEHRPLRADRVGPSLPPIRKDENQR